MRKRLLPFVAAILLNGPAEAALIYGSDEVLPANPESSLASDLVTAHAGDGFQADSKSELIAAWFAEFGYTGNDGARRTQGILAADAESWTDAPAPAAFPLFLTALAGMGLLPRGRGSN